MTQVFSRKRFFWALGLAVVGLWFGVKSGILLTNFGLLAVCPIWGTCTTVEVSGSELLAVFPIWGACIGYGVGTIFDQRRVGRRIILYWSVTLVLVGILFSPAVPLNSLSAQLAVAAGSSAVVGALVGALHLGLARRRPFDKLRVRTRKIIWVVALAPFAVLWLAMMYVAEFKSEISLTGQLVLGAVSVAFIGVLVGGFYVKFGRRRSQASGEGTSR